MKKIFARIILGSFLTLIFGYAFWDIVISLCIDLGKKYGFIGVVSWLLTLGVIACVIYVTLRIIFWAVDNS